PLDDSGDDQLDAGRDVARLREEEKGTDGAEAEVDVGPLGGGLHFDESEEGSGDPEATADLGPEGDEIDIDERGGADDGGAEGTSDDPEDEVDEAALPELDADDEGDEGDDELAGILLADTEIAALPWDAARWTLVEGAGA